MKNFLKQYRKHIIIGAVMFLIIILVGNYVNTLNSINTLKKDLLNETTSDDKILVNRIKEQNTKIDLVEKLIETSKKELEQTKLINICTKTQLDRLLQGVEYNINYCTGSNLKQFENF